LNQRLVKKIKCIKKFNIWVFSKKVIELFIIFF
jgi:hypothetical protein